MTGLHWPSLRPTLIDHGRLLHAITVEGELLAGAASSAAAPGGVSGPVPGAGPGDLPVPGCPGATVASTVEHTGSVYFQALDWIRGGGRPDRLRRVTDFPEFTRSTPPSSSQQPPRRSAGASPGSTGALPGSARAPRPAEQSGSARSPWPVWQPGSPWSSWSSWEVALSRTPRSGPSGQPSASQPPPFSPSQFSSPPEPSSAPPSGSAPPSDDDAHLEDLVAFSSRARQALVLELTAHAPGEPCATAWPDNQTYSFWRRRIAHETTVHRVDVQAALGLPVDPVAVDFAADGIDEVLRFWFGHRLRQIGMTATTQGAVGIHVSDLSWLVILGRVRSTARRVPVSDARAADAVVTGDPMSVYLWLWGRVPDQSVTITGDIDATAQLWALLRTATQ